MPTIDTPLDTQFRYNVFVHGASRGEIFFHPTLGWRWYHDGQYAAVIPEPGARRHAYDIIGHAESCQESDIALLVRDAQARGF